MKLFYFFGDSVTLGVNDAPAGGWVARLAGKAAERGLNVPPDTFYNLGVRKNSSRDILARWEAEYRARAMEGCPATLVFCFGTVDMAAPHAVPNVPVGESAANAREILMKAKEYGSVVLVSAPPVKDEEHRQRIEALCTAYASIAKAVGVPFVDIFHPLMELGYVDDLADGVHPGPHGNEMIAGLLADSEAMKKTFAD
jgi:lysophospholipase L1-like esterase